MPKTKHIDDMGFLVDEAVKTAVMAKHPNRDPVREIRDAVCLNGFSGDIIFPAPAPGAPDQLSILVAPIMYIPCIPTDGSDEAVVGQFEDLFDDMGVKLPGDFQWLGHIVHIVGDYDQAE